MDEGWTHVRHKSRRPRHNHLAQSQSQTGTHASLCSPSTEIFTPRTTNLRPVSALEAEYAKFQSQWLHSPCRSSLVKLVQEHAGECAKVTDAVCLGIGSFDPESGGWESKRSAYLQLCAFTTLVSTLESTANKIIKCIHQEPILTSSDKTFLSNLGHQVLDSPHGCEAINSNTLLFGVHLYRPIYAMALKTHIPAIFVGTPWDVWDEVTLEETDDLRNLESMDKTHQRVNFPPDPSSTAFSSTAIYFPSSAEAGHDSGGNEAPAPRRDDSHETAVRNIAESMEHMGLANEHESREEEVAAATDTKRQP